MDNIWCPYCGSWNIVNHTWGMSCHNCHRNIWQGSGELEHSTSNCRDNYYG